MFWLKGCPKCAGDLKRTVEIEGTIIACLQCGYELTRQQARLLIQPASGLRQAAAAGERLLQHTA